MSRDVTTLTVSKEIAREIREKSGHNTDEKLEKWAEEHDDGAVFNIEQESRIKEICMDLIEEEVFQR